MKMKRMERDMPKFLRAQSAYMSKFDNEISSVRKDAQERLGMRGDENNNEEYQYQRQTIEELLSRT